MGYFFHHYPACSACSMMKKSWIKILFLFIIYLAIYYFARVAAQISEGQGKTISHGPPPSHTQHNLHCISAWFSPSLVCVISSTGLTWTKQAHTHTSVHFHLEKTCAMAAAGPPCPPSHRRSRTKSSSSVFEGTALIMSMVQHSVFDFFIFL